VLCFNRIALLFIRGDLKRGVQNDRYIFLSRKEAAVYLREKYGAPGAVTPGTLAKFACLGGGPVFHHIGRKPGYLPADLDAWVQSRCSGPLRNTSDIITA